MCLYATAAVTRTYVCGTQKKRPRRPDRARLRRTCETDAEEIGGGGRDAVHLAEDLQELEDAEEIAGDQSGIAGTDYKEMIKACVRLIKRWSKGTTGARSQPLLHDAFFMFR
eukprot:6136542-Pleurochrysis_carterae.AAC.5